MLVGGVPRSPYAKARQWAAQLTREIRGGKYALKGNFQQKRNFEKTSLKGELSELSEFSEL